MSDLGNDLKHALQMFTKSPGFTLAAVSALALGIGANTAIFSVVNAVLLKPLEYPEADRIVSVVWKTPQGNSEVASITKFHEYEKADEHLQGRGRVRLLAARGSTSRAADRSRCMASMFRRRISVCSARRSCWDAHLPSRRMHRTAQSGGAELRVVAAEVWRQSKCGWKLAFAGQ